MKSHNRKRGLIVFLLISVFFIFGSLNAFSQSCGDANNSGAVDIVDALVIAQYYVGLAPSQIVLSAADVDGNGTVDIVDALRVAQYYVGLSTQLSCANQTPGATATAVPGTQAPTVAPTAAPTGGGSCGTCVGYGTYPYCCDPATSDPEGDGWGWENNASCIVKGSTVEYAQTCDCPSPLVCPNTAKCSCYHVEGLGTNKKALTAAGGTRYDMASAMMETENISTNYTYGDGKTGDATNFGVCKQNWGMIRQSHPAWRNLGPADYHTADSMNTDRAFDMTILHESKAYFGSLWWAGHRNGSTGLANPDTADIANFHLVMDWTDEQLGRDPVLLTNNVRFAVDVGAI
jgi:hypothetical protein